nr:RecName: Full=Antifungal protein 1 large subunit; AltName: Full=CW-1 [Malva parviflora]
VAGPFRIPPLRREFQ